MPGRDRRAAQAFLFPDSGPLDEPSVHGSSRSVRVARKSRWSSSAETARAASSGPIASSR
jgi:hypothetical protein